MTGKNRLIRLECPHNTEVLSDQYLVEVARAVEHAAHARGYDLLLRLGSERRDTSQFQAVDGLVLLSAPKMTTDELMALLATLGHRRVGYISSGFPGSEVRAALPCLMAGAGLEWDLTLVGRGWRDDGGWLPGGDPAFEPAVTADRAVRPDGCAGRGGDPGRASSGLSVPQDVSVIGHDDTVVAALVTPPLTTVAIDIPRVGAATEALLRVIDESAALSLQTLPTRLKVRQSTGPRRQGNGISSLIVYSSSALASSSA